MPQNLAVKLLINAKDNASGVFSKLKSNVAGIATAILGYFSVNFFASAADDAADLQTDMLALQGIIEATGSAAGLTADEIAEMSKRLDEQTLGSAEGFRQASKSLLTFKSIGKDSFETVLSLAQDLATAGFGSLESNAKQLGKALEDPVRGMSELRRVGVSFTESQTELIKSLVETGNKAKAQGVILEVLAGQVGGAGAAAAKGLEGVNDLIDKLITDSKEAFGAGLLEPLTKLKQGVADFLSELNDNGQIEAFGQLVGTTLKGLITLVQDYGRAVVSLGGAYVLLKTKSVVAGLLSVGTAVNTTAKAMTAATVATIKSTVATTTNTGVVLRSAAVTATATVAKVKWTAATIASTVATKAATAAQGLFSAGLARVGALAQLGAYTFIATQILSLVENYGKLKVAQSVLADSEKQLTENTTQRLEKMREVADQLGLNIDALGNNTSAIAQAIVEKRKDIDATDAQTNAQRDFVAEVEKGLLAGNNQISLLEKTGTEFGILAQATSDLSDAQEKVIDKTGQTSEAISKLSDKYISELLNKIELVNQSDIFVGTGWDDLKNGLLHEQFERIGLDFDEIAGKVTETGQAGADAFINIAQSAELTEEQISKVAEKLIETANTRADIDLLRQSFEDVGFEAGKHPELIEQIVQKIIQLGGSLEDIPGQWRDIAAATDEATSSVRSYESSVNSAADRQQHLNNLADGFAAKSANEEANVRKFVDSLQVNRGGGTVKTSSFNSAQQAAFGGLTPQQMASLEALIADSSRKLATSGGTRGGIDTGAIVLAMGEQNKIAQQAAKEQTQELKNVSSFLKRSGSITVNIDGREIAASVQRAGLTAR